MKIQGPGYGNEAPRAERGNKSDAPESSSQSAAAKPAAPEAPADAVEISVAALEIDRLLESAKASPDVRATVVERLREAVRSGNYQVNDRSLATRIVEEYLAR
ncbi:MAG: flagellar biosynthesis anti-sigma factor FlgM [Acidobacteria bacterium]|nr:flagellar biosynthesis anti-sigma factor FlgM [Acidobacteriota bacterium]